MIRSKVFRAIVLALFVLVLVKPGSAQSFPFTSGPIPPCDTSTFTASVSGVGWLIYPNGWDWGPYLESVMIDITTDHPQTLEISLTSPSGTTVLLSAFNGAGGQNYTNTNFTLSAWIPITSGTAPFTGDFVPQSGSLGDFAGENADGVWTMTVVDTACANGGTGPGGNWTPGWFNGGVGTGAFAFGFASPPPPCIIDMGWQTGTLCSGGSVDVLSYFETNWAGGMGAMFTVWETFTGTPVADPYAVTTPGQYQVEGSDWSGCYYMGYYEVALAPAIALGPDQLVQQCPTTSAVDLSALFNLLGATATSWTLDGTPIPTSNATAAILPGVYELTATNQCSADVAQVTLTLGSAPVLGADQTVTICAGGSVDLTTLYNTAGYTSEWSYGGVVVAIPESAVDAGVYTLLVSTLDGCTDMADVTLVVGTSLALGADQAHNLCDNSSLDLTALYTTTGSTVVWTYNSAPVMTPGTVYQGGTYQLVATTNGGCTDTALVVVTLDQSPDLGGDLIDNTCADVAADLTIFYSTTGLTTSWTLGGVAVPDPAVVYDAGLYMLVATNVSGCSDTAYTEIVVDPVPVLGPDVSITACTGVVVDLTAVYSTGANVTAWTESGVPVADPTSVTSAGVYTVTVTTNALCTATAEVSLALDPAPTLAADVSTAICDGSTFDLSTVYSTAGLAVAWTVGGAPVADPSSVAVNGNYQLVVTNGTGCTDTAVVVLAVDPNPALGSDLSFSLCPWQTVDLSAVFPTAGATATYTLNDQPVSDPTGVTDPGTYVVTVTDANGCTDEAAATVAAVECLCEADFIHDASCIQDPAQFTLVADSTVLSASWDFDGAAANSTAIDPMVIITSEGDVLVTLQATLSCGVVEVQHMIQMQDCSDLCNVWIPSAFTPDNDGRNDTWAWSGECEPEDFKVEVYDRWGEVIFASNDPFTSWDGKYNGTLSPSGVYAYRVGYRLPYQKRKEVAGSITMVR